MLGYSRLPTDANTDTIPLNVRGTPDLRGANSLRNDSGALRSYTRTILYIVGIFAVALVSFRLGQLSAIIDIPPHKAPGGIATPSTTHTIHATHPTEPIPSTGNDSGTRMADKLSVG